MATPRERLVYTAAQHLREHGVEGTGLRPLVADAGAPWGSLRHYFPGGKDQLVVEALGWSGSYAAAVVERYLRRGSPTARGLLRVVVRWWVDDLESRDFARGCPVAAAVADCAHTNPTIRAAAAGALEAWRSPIRDGIVALGFTKRDADELATVLLAALEGGILMARAQRSTEPLRVVERRLLPLLQR